VGQGRGVEHGRPHGGVRFILGTGGREGLREVVGGGAAQVCIAEAKNSINK